MEKDPCKHKPYCGKREETRQLAVLDRQYCDWPSHVDCEQFMKYEEREIESMEVWLDNPSK